MSSSLLLQQCPACLVRLILLVFLMDGRWPHSCCFVGCFLQDLFNIARSILALLPSSFFPIRLVSVHVVHPYNSIDTPAAWKKQRFILSVSSDFPYSSSVPIRDVALKTGQKQWRGSERWSGISVLMSWIPGPLWFGMVVPVRVPSTEHWSVRKLFVLDKKDWNCVQSICIRKEYFIPYNRLPIIIIIITTIMMTNHEICKCSKLAQNKYQVRLDWVGKVIHWELCKKFKFDYTNKWYVHNPESIQENEMHKLL